MSAKIEFTRNNLDDYLSKVAKEFRKLNGRKMRAEIILIGGASILANYGFRDSTYDIDALIRASSAMKDAINKVGDEYGLPNGWLNSDFTTTDSYSPNLIRYSKYYKTFGYVLDVRSVSGEYLVAMKLMSARQYKNDISDIVGILKEEKDNGNSITLDTIKTAVCNLYGDWNSLPQYSQNLITEIMKNDEYDKLYEQYRIQEKSVKKSLIEFDNKYPSVANEDNISQILDHLKNKSTKASHKEEN